MLTATEQEMLRELAEAEGIKMSGVIRKCIRAEYGKLQRKAARG
jgi:hypothetical protein